MRALALVAAAWGLAGCASVARPPSWAASPPDGFRYAYVVGAGSAADAASARRAALEDAYAMLVRTAPRAYETAAFRQSLDVMVEEAVGAEGPGRTAGTQRLRTEAAVEGSIAGQTVPRLELVSTDVRRCLRCTETSAYVLLRYPKPASQRSDPPSTPGFVARSLVVPGWGQMTKGSRVKGWVLLLGTAGSAGMAAVAHQRYRAHVDDAAAATSQVARDRALALAEPHRTTMVGGLAAAGALYGYGLWDAAVGPVRFYPLRTAWGGVGVGVRVP